MLDDCETEGDDDALQSFLEPCTCAIPEKPRHAGRDFLHVRRPSIIMAMLTTLTVASIISIFITKLPHSVSSRPFIVSDGVSSPFNLGTRFVCASILMITCASLQLFLEFLTGIALKRRGLRYNQKAGHSYALSLKSIIQYHNKLGSACTSSPTTTSFSRSALTLTRSEAPSDQVC